MAIESSLLCHVGEVRVVDSDARLGASSPCIGPACQIHDYFIDCIHGISSLWPFRPPAAQARLIALRVRLRWPSGVHAACISAAAGLSTGAFADFGSLLILLSAGAYRFSTIPILLPRQRY